MKIKIWQAFASNNSGSYTIIGSFESAERAAEVAAAIRAVAEQHTAWLASVEDREPGDSSSPLAAFAREHGLSWQEGHGSGDDWPEHDGDNIPDVTAAGHQVLVHVGYTVTMPPTFGEFFYKHGGRVATEIVHSHTRIVATFTAYWPWEERKQKKVDRSVAAVIEELTRDDGTFARLASPEHPPEWIAVGDKAIEGDLMITCVLDDLCSGCREISEAITRHGGQSFVRISELDH